MTKPEPCPPETAARTVAADLDRDDGRADQLDGVDDGLRIRIK